MQSPHTVSPLDAHGNKASPVSSIVVRRSSSLLLLSLFHSFLLTLFVGRPASATPVPWEAAPPKLSAFQHTPIKEEVTIGENALLKCRVNYKDKYKVVWSRDSKTLTFNEQRRTNDDRIFIRRLPHERNVWDLAINHVRDSDAGDYHCIVNTQPPQKRTVRLVIKEPPSISGPLTHVEVLHEHQSLRIPCYGSGNPSPKIEWRREDVDQKIYPLSNDRKADLYVERSKEHAELVVSSAKRWMEGTYACVATNGIYPPARKTLTLIIQFQAVVYFVNSRIGQSVGGTTMLQCKFESNPLGTVTWEFNGKPIRPQPPKCPENANMAHMCQETILFKKEPTKSQNDLTIRNVSANDYGDYECVVTSDMGTSRAKAKLYKIVSHSINHRRRYQNDDSSRGSNPNTPRPLPGRRGPDDSIVITNTISPRSSSNRHNSGPLPNKTGPSHAVLLVLIGLYALLQRLPGIAQL